MSPEDKLRLSMIQYTWTDLRTQNINIDYTGGYQNFNLGTTDLSACLLIRFTYSMSSQVQYTRNGGTIHVRTSIKIGGYPIDENEVNDSGSGYYVYVRSGASGTVFCRYDHNDGNYHYYEDQSMSSEVHADPYEPTSLDFTYTPVSVSGLAHINTHRDLSGTVAISIVK